MDDVQGPLVFQCASCRLIIGDSTSMISADAELKSISLRSAGSLQVGTKFEVSQSGKDSGCTYFAVKCLGCKTLVGRKYHTTSSEMDSIRGAFTLQTDKLTSYTLGGGKADEVMPTAAPDVKLEEINAVVTMLQEMMLGFNERIEELERRVLLPQPSQEQLQPEVDNKVKRRKKTTLIATDA
eukprot:TRINITY_DN14781_c0_g1_i1.p1 TRINITY_DN14781_c0_g1~~TRINITY_DN14781_c0_g1_i1.p1  ORF type:complete len:192 (-),score=36.94 TRINITY_DN14781_c0_g1_i1:15-560(-)